VGKIVEIWMIASISVLKIRGRMKKQRRGTRGEGGRDIYLLKP
jgi:hypothetical protein